MNYKGYEAIVQFDDKDEIFSGEVIFTLKSTTYYGGVLDQLWHDAVTGPSLDLDQVLADAIASLR